MLTMHLNTDTKIPLYEQIYTNVKRLILQGELKAGDKLPSTRGLAATLDVSRNTVETAYYQLLAEGYIDTAPKSGFYVSELDLTGIGLAAFSNLSLLQAENQEQPNTPLPSVMAPNHETTSVEDSSKTRSITYDFSPFAVDISHFPYSIWKKLSKKTLEEDTNRFLLGEADGDMELRQAICNYVRLSREVRCSPEQIIVGAGADYLLQMLSLVFRHMNIQEITLENPCYRKAAMIFENNGLHLHTGTLDGRGLTIDSIASETEVVYVTPSHQYPLGIVMPLGRRSELLTWADQTDRRYIIEDDHDSEFRYKGKPIPALQGMDWHDKVIYLGTFSRAIAPAIRVSYLILPPDLIKIYHRYLSHYSCTVSRLDQGILTRFLEEGYFEKHVNRMRKIYRNKHDLVLEQLKPLIRQNILQIQGEHAGLHLVLHLRKGLTESQVIEQAAKQNIKLYGMKKHYLHPSDRACESILFGYSNLTESEITEGIRRLSLILLHLTV